MWVGAAITLVLLSFIAAQIKPAVPSVDGSTVWIDSVKTGPMFVQARGRGMLVPHEVLVIAAPADSRVDAIRVSAGTLVQPDSVIAVLSNVELEQAAQDADAQLRIAAAELAGVQARYEIDMAEQKAVAATVESEYQQAQLRVRAEEQLAKEGLSSQLTLAMARSRFEEWESRRATTRQRLALSARSLDAQLAAQRARVDQARTFAALKRQQLQALSVTARIPGVVERVMVEAGQRVAAGVPIAKIADQQRLKAVLRIPEVQARDVKVGQRVELTISSAAVRGQVARIDPTVEGGAVSVDVAIEGELPRGARAQQSVVGAVEIAHLPSATYVARPTGVQERSTAGVFKVLPGRTEAERVQVEFGLGSADTIQIVSGLRAGDRVIVSDASQWAAHDRIALND